MDIEAYKEAIANADVAFANARFENAVAWYDKALKEAPDDGYALSKAGTALVSLNRFDDAFVYFNRAVESDPQNGDHVFNLANAYFFAGDIPKAMENYTAAEMMECSDDVRARIYYQLALMCSIKRDYKAALINYQKYEDADKTGQVSLDTDVLSERVQLYLQVEDFDNATLEAASDLGANAWQTFWKVQFPMLLPGIVAGGLLAFTLSIDDFVITFFVAGQGSDTLPVKIYGMIRRSRNLPVINALSTLMMCVTVLAVVATRMMQGRGARAVAPSSSKAPVIGERREGLGGRVRRDRAAD